eukprot:2114302-Prymnesium_polylepis.3
MQKQITEGNRSDAMVVATPDDGGKLFLIGGTMNSAIPDGLNAPLDTSLQHHRRNDVWVYRLSEAFNQPNERREFHVRVHLRHRKIDFSAFPHNARREDQEMLEAAALASA